MKTDVLSIQDIDYIIRNIRGKKVILDTDLANLYQVKTKRLNEQIKRNMGRFPEEFLFQLTEEENRALRSQIATSKISEGRKTVSPLCVY